MSDDPKTPEEEPVDPTAAAPDVPGAVPADAADVAPDAAVAGPPPADEPGEDTPSLTKDDDDAVVERAPAPTRRRRTPTGEAVLVSAKAKYVRTSARKARLVCDHIRGKDVVQAQAILAHSPRAVAEAWEKLLKSAVANAEHNHELDADELKIVSVFADEGPTLKRFQPRAMGRATKIRKRTSHLSITLTQKEA